MTYNTPVIDLIMEYISPWAVIPGPWADIFQYEVNNWLAYIFNSIQFNSLFQMQLKGFPVRGPYKIRQEINNTNIYSKF